ncbi:MAG: hypothetical protein V3V81_07635 [Candidatus Bathyarchaeia archaeon]
MEKHFVRFLSPGTFVVEATQKPIESWDVDEAVKLSKDIKERYNTLPYGFYFITRSRDDSQLDSKETDTSNMYYLGGKVETFEEIKRSQPGSILAKNMEYNNWDRVITNTNSWKVTQPFKDGDVVINIDEGE